MSLVVALADIKPEKIRQTKFGTSTSFIRVPAGAPGEPAPDAKLVRHSNPGFASNAHFHVVDQFQIIVDGKGKFGRHDVTPYCVHFSRAHTPYGPLLPDDKGWAFLTLRTRHDPGSQGFPEAKDKLRAIPGRHPWQVTKKVTFPIQGSDVSMQDIPEIKDDQGLLARSLTMTAGTRCIAPDPARGDGQYVVVLRGSLMHDNKEHKAPVITFVSPDDPAFPIHAGPQGLDAVIVNFPQVKPRAQDSVTPSARAAFKKWQCALCSFAYDEALGMPEDGVPAGTRWKDVPETWTCPDCSANKSDFEMVEV